MYCNRYFSIKHVLYNKRRHRPDSSCNNFSIAFGVVKVGSNRLNLAFSFKNSSQVNDGCKFCASLDSKGALLPTMPPPKKGLKWWCKYSCWYIFERDKTPAKLTAKLEQQPGPSDGAPKTEFFQYFSNEETPPGNKRRFIE